MDAVTELRKRGGIARTRTLVRAGVSTYAVRRAKESGQIVTVRSGWVAVPDADQLLLGAVRRGVVLSCVTVAERRGLWVPERTAFHVAAAPNGSRIEVPAHVVVHWSKPVIDRSSDDIEDHLVNALSIIAQCQPAEQALVIWESALNKGLVDRQALARLPLPPAAVAVLEQARPFADSGLETIIIFRLRWMGVPMLPQAWVLGHRVDLLIGERLVVQIDGATHTGAQRTSDIRHDAELTLRGYHVLRFSYEQIMDRWEQVQAIIMEAVAQGLHRAAR
ncbi:type IV toxin-antitoxin system AbiEi family antitoxin domain-containing protein [Microbacterium sp.]|uniref:type IV toxin-antitoxin system AbiEi family antitoxin domain-containing protein n=1 Tax=Microbacterium sp. TaxID=51671 RepID=UPI002810FBE2|nr:type IV toxin-antitoxin system AbiEi family antitoxin domain-containing protein [Microbacterium sp.]